MYQLSLVVATDSNAWWQRNRERDACASVSTAVLAFAKKLLTANSMHTQENQDGLTM
jgi:hypothetical protein